MDYKISSAACAGRYHRGQGAPCQDKVCRMRVNDVVCIALADGAGSRQYSEYGAERVVFCICGVMCRDFDDLWCMEDGDLAELLIRECLWDLSGMALPMDELASTLLFFAAHRDGRCITGHLGDGAVIRMDEAGELTLASAPENGAYLNETWFTTSPDAPAHLRLTREVLTEEGAVLLMSDGMTESLCRRGNGIPADACRTLARWLAEGEEQRVDRALEENMEQVFSKRSSDDLSLGLVTWRREEH